MIFFHPMWDSEGQRLGMKACTPLGYGMRIVGDLIGFLGLITFFLIPANLLLRFIRHQFSTHDLWLLLVPLIIGIIGRILFELGWKLATNKQYKYDYETMTVTWIEKGQERSFAYKR